jgi:hypothetical protein
MVTGKAFPRVDVSCLECLVGIPWERLSGPWASLDTFSWSWNGKSGPRRPKTLG